MRLRAAALALAFLGGCGWIHGSAPGGHEHHHPHHNGHGVATAGPAPSLVSSIKMISWAEPGSGGCESDLEGSAPPASFRLRYTEGEVETVVENDPEELFAAGWEIVTRSARGMGFEKHGDVTALDFDVVEELQCRCGDDWKESALIEVDVDWSAGARPTVDARLREGSDLREIVPVTINGRLAAWDLRFARPFREGAEGECASRFLLLLGLDQPIE